MRIGFLNIFGELKNAEQETLMRLKYCFENQGHEFLVLDAKGTVTNDCIYHGKHIEHVNADFLFTYNTLETAIRTFPDVFSVFFHWSPLGFVANFQTLLGIKYFNLFDSFASTYEQDIFNRIDKISVYSVPFMGSSVPLDFCLPARKHTDRKLFYAGVNFERKLIKMRYEELFRSLDESDRLEIYGPRRVYGAPDLWRGFKSYRGEIPFDGKSILHKINQAGICLALNSPMHNDAGGVSNRTYEAAAAGALIISDDNAFVRKYFKDSVFYIDIDEKEEKSFRKIADIVDWANSHPEEAYQMAKTSSEIFKRELTLDSMIKGLLPDVKRHIRYIQDVSNQHECIDIVCFVESLHDFDNIYCQLSRQYYKNIRLIIISEGNVQQEIRQKYHDKNFVFVPGAGSDRKGASFAKAIPYIESNYFMFIDAFCIMHKRHIYKNLDVLMNYDTLFSYSGCYIKAENGYIDINNKPILRDEFLYFSSNYAEDWHSKDIQSFFIETIFSRSSALFKKAILDIVDDEELNIISNNIHHYLACCAIIKKGVLGRFTHALTTGYAGKSLEDINNTVFNHRKHWHSNGRAAKTYIKEMNEIFFKYTFETTPNFVITRYFSGDAEGKGFSRREARVVAYVMKNKAAHLFAKILTRRMSKTCPEEDVRMVQYWRKHHLVRNLFSFLAKNKEK